MISQAPLLSIFAVGILIVVIYLFMQLLYRSRLKLREEQIAALQKQITGLPAQKSGDGIYNYKNNISSTKPGLWVLAFGVAWYKGENMVPFCMKCNFPLTQSMSDDNLLCCPACSGEYPLIYGSKRYLLDEAIKTIEENEIGTTFSSLGT